MTPLFMLTGQILLAILVLASSIGFVLRLRNPGNATIVNLNARINAWWIMAVVLFSALVLGRYVTIVVFGFASLMALREFLTLTPTRKSDYWPLFIAFFIALPAQYWLLWTQWYGLFAIMIPVYIFFLISAASAISQDTDDFLSRNARILFAVMFCVYGVSHAPALLMLDIPSFRGHNAQLLFFFVFIVQISDVLQYIFGKLFGKHKMVPKLSPNKTWEGLLGGGLATMGIGALLAFVTPFTPLQAAGMAALIVIGGVMGGLVMSGVKRSLGAKDWGTGIAGHGGYMDRLDSLGFAAPVFFHIVRWIWALP
ncbi:phosphatidate cytidylyltransferase [Massilia sp. CCM 8733]|uniref:Phosphatidate cytidylyltransferase n=1 Tax=Massilia mucilaginosa TaxID=2609282 RepID=A0ABX0NNU8_9BURK|nr:phosphatidate cytidylyltransferase [Massilia mucilaginosa]NHZ88492.1 phosphatidate cytidylyltransferase [Massilia mucilaginosa]